MSIKLVEIIKGLLIKQDGVLNPAKVEILPGGTAGTKTTIQTAQTSDAIITLPAVTSTLASTAYVTSSSGVVNDLLDDHIADPSAAHAASAISTTSSNVQSDLNTISSTLTDLDSRLDTIESAVITDPVTKSEVDAADAGLASDISNLTSVVNTKLPLSGGTMTGNIEIGTNKITSGADGIDFAGNAVRTYSGLGGEITVDSNIVIDANTIQVIGNNFDSFVDLDLNNIGKVRNSIDPTSVQDLTTKNYVDNNITSGITELAAANWTARTSAADNAWTSIIYGNSTFLAISSSATDNRIMGSSDGYTWAIRTGVPNSGWVDMAYGFGRYVAVANTGTPKIITSTNASGASSTWSNITIFPDITYSSVVNTGYSSTKFLAVASAGTSRCAVSSSDGFGSLSWTTYDVGTTYGWNSVAYGNSVCIAIGGSQVALVINISPTGSPVGHSIITLPSGCSLFTKIVYGNGKFVAVGYNISGYKAMVSSDNGATWTPGTGIEGTQLKDVAYANGLFVAVGYDDGTSSGNEKFIWVSEDGITWTGKYAANTNAWRQITAGKNMFVATSTSGTGNRVMTSLKF